ncbi:MAG: zinc ribbon domain-containing protein [Planctomycetaceae bacterium]|nr:zinc ribbon domain-containing protein [Planctomycetaceae bacterium]
MKNLKGKGCQKNSIEDWLVSEESLFEPIISAETFKKAYDLQSSKRRGRVRQNPKAVYAGFIICENCGVPMTADGVTYRCTTYLNKGGPRSGCTRNKVKESVIDKYVDSWLEETGQTLAWTGEATPVTSLYKTRDINDRMRSLMVIIEHYLADKLSQAFSYEDLSDGGRSFEIETIDGVHEFTLPGYDGDPSFLQNLLGTVEASENASMRSSIVKLEARKAHLLSIFPEAQNKSLRETLVRELNTLDSQIELAQGGVTDYAKQHKELIVQLHEMWRASKRARTIEAPQARRKALRELIMEIRCKFVQKIVKKCPRSKLEGLTIIPELSASQEDVRSTGAGW